MKLKPYLKKHDITQAEFADLLGVTQGLIGHYVTNRQTCTNPITLRRIEKLTGGLVKRQDMYPEMFKGMIKGD